MRAKMLDLVEEPLDEVAIAVEEGAESRDVDASRHGFDVGPGAALRQALAERIAIIGPVGQQDPYGWYY